MNSREFWELVDKNGGEIFDTCTAGVMNPCPDACGKVHRSCACRYNECLDGMTYGMDMRFVHVDCPKNPIPEELCSCSKKTDLGTRTNISVPFIEVRTGIVFQAIQGACVFYKTIVDVLKSRCGESFEAAEDFSYKSILDFKKGDARPKDYAVGRVEPQGPGIGGALRRGIYRVFHSWAS
jgi:hypothetical protein